MPGEAKAVAIGKASDIAAGKGRVFAAEGLEIAVFNVDGAFHAIDNICPHLGGPLGEGVLQSCVVTCPWHGREYDVRTGVGLFGDGDARRFDLRVDGDVLMLLIPPE